ncbi:hypothetical protein GQ651_08695 [Alphaproteobacteria bacterium GH1-50]|uniref:Uncharacterized protein n=1 Tax=Kangsaoukella pontilimi TaxID=2691042 RepID=A0A7C9IQN9_9RHOB|nr:hypothetical protein [Kangsaoukella pontilimi]MXQ07923.1 hypothetical protein [Kangsaoukella pontilimi]
MNELAVTALLCGLLGGGVTEQKQYFPSLGETRHIRTDCETPTHVIEVGLDNTSSARDSVHQAVFASMLTGKRPMVILIDTDGMEGRYEQEMRLVTRRLGVPYGTCRKNFVLRWAATSPFRGVGLDKTLDDLPQSASTRTHCELGAEFQAPSLGN